MKILFQIRPNALSQRGGDTVVLERVCAGLQRLGVTTKLDLDGTANLQDYDCVFLFNFTLPQLLRQQAERAKQANLPYVVMALNEDIPSFHSQSHFAAAVLMEYAKAGQPKEKFLNLFPDPWATTPAKRFDNEWVARNAAIIFTTGESESNVIKQYYPGIDNIVEAHLGFETLQKGSAEEFEKQFGIKDFILSVARIESRKNQLMLLKALEDETLPLVLASGGFTYQPDYDQAVRSFKRAGPTIILDKLSDQELANAFSASKIHVLPSWYELPGLVSMEAASFGKNIVVTKQGSAKDYFKTDAFYCDPACPESVKNAVLAAYHSPLKAGLVARVAQFSWERNAKVILSAIEKVITPKTRKVDMDRLENSITESKEQSSIGKSQSVNEIIQEAEQIARTGDFQQALGLVIEHKSHNPKSAALWRAQGMLMIALQKHKEAQSLLQTALSLDPNDSKIICGLGICAKQDGQIEAASDLFVRSLQLDKSNKIAILQLLSVSYELNDFASLETVLKNYVKANSTELEMTYALAGCLYRQGKFEEAEYYCKEITAQSPNHSGSNELLALIRESLTKLNQASKEYKQTQPETLKVTIPEVRNSALNPNLEQQNSATSNVRDSISKIIDLKRNQKLNQGLTECAQLLGKMSLDSPELEEIYALQGELLALNGQINEAEHRFNSMLVQYPNSVRALCGLGALYGEQRNWAKAEEQFRKSIAINARCDVGYAGLALSSLQAGDKEAAWHYYEKALEVNPENLRAVFGILELGYPQARYQEIERVLRNYLELHPANLDFLYSLAGCFYAQNRLSEANQEIEKILLFSPGHSKAIELKDAIENKRNIG